MNEERLEKINTRVWDTVVDRDEFPELDDAEFKNDWVIAHRDFGIVFSGGGTRSASATLGQLRGLKEIGLLDKAGYVSAVSGGSWAVTPFTFLPNHISEDTFLGPVVPPEKLSIDDIEYSPKGSLAYAISNTVLADDIFRSIKGDETYARVIGRLFLKPFELDDTSKFFTYDEQSLAAALSINRGDKYFLMKEDFYLARKNRPFQIIGGTLFIKENSPEQRKMQIEYTPIYTGIRSNFPKAGKKTFPIFGKKRDIGGGYVETYAYDSREPMVVENNRIFQATLKSRTARFTLSDMIGSSGAAPEETIHRFKLTFLGFPEFRHWNIHPISDINESSAAEYPHGDGGHLENLGLMPLLARKVKKIIVFINTSSPFKISANGNGASYTDDLAPLFGRADNVEQSRNEVQLRVNQVFASEKLDGLIKSFSNCVSQGDTLIHVDDYQVMENNHYGIGSYQTRICWIYNSRVDRWRDLINNDSVKKLVPSMKGKVDGEFERFPHYRTFFEKTGRIIDLTARQVNMLSHLSCWNVMEHRQKIIEFLEK